MTSRAAAGAGAGAGADLELPWLVCLFHLNLAFSSLEEEAHVEIIRRCYSPALELPRATGFPIALEATGWTLRRIAELDPGWIETLRGLMAEGLVELVGSAHAQCAAALLPAEVNAWNLRLGREVYLELLDAAPRIALVCEQVYSPGLVPLYLDAGYEALIVDWDNARRSHLQWPDEYRLHPQRALGGGRSIPILWSKSIAFQKFQRFAHGELSLERYLAYVRGVIDGGRGVPGGRALMLYANDVEIFDHRPGRFAAEPELQEDEWERIAVGLRALRERCVGTPGLPSEMLALLKAPAAGHELELEAPGEPVPVKKQDKYNVSRWAVTGRDDLGINTRCQRLYEHLNAQGCTEPERWRELCELWASDFRTHITGRRWAAYLERLGAVERRWGVRGVAAETRGAPRPMPSGDRDSPRREDTPPRREDTPPRREDTPPRREDTPPRREGNTARREGDTARREGDTARRERDTARRERDTARREGDTPRREGDTLVMRAGPLELRLNLRRGLAIESFADARVVEQPLLGTLEHGYFPTIELGADFYSGHLVQESPLTHKVTDLARVTPALGRDARGRLCAAVSIDTDLGPIEKVVRLGHDGIELEWTLRWPELPAGSLRLGHVTLLPEAFAAGSLWMATHNGGHILDRHRIAGPAFDHGAAVSALVSCRQGLGVTEGLVLLGDANRTLRVEVDRSLARPLGLLAWVPDAERWFLRLCFSLSESDDTRRGATRRDPHADPQRFRLRVRASRSPAR